MKIILAIFEIILLFNFCFTKIKINIKNSLENNQKAIKKKLGDLCNRKTLGSECNKTNKNLNII